MAGCHDISDETPSKDWSRDLQRGNGNDNDEIAVASPIWLDIDGNGAPELVVPFGMRLWAFDGNTGASADINNAWSSPLAMPHRVWASPAAADMDGDGTIDLLVGDTLVSQLVTDLAPLADGRGISFNPANPDPGDQVTVTGQFSNIGTLDNQENVDVVLRMNGDEIARERFADVEPVSPSGEGGPLTFSSIFTAELGAHEFSLVLDVNNNLTEARKDNNNASTILTILDPYVARIDPPTEAIRISPGASDTITIHLTAIGSRSAEWTLSIDDDALPSGWSFSATSGTSLSQNLEPNAPVALTFDVAIPSTALGDENSYVDLNLVLDDDSAVSSTLRLPLEVLRTRGLSVVGPSGLSDTTGYGRPNHDASAWLVVENLGNAQESTTSIDWTAPSWGGTPSLHTSDGTEVFSLTLGPNQDIELFAKLAVPSGVQLGTSTESMLTMCIGSGETTLCQDLEVMFYASKFQSNPAHVRTLPNTTITWDLDTTLPNDGTLQWNMAGAQMVHTGWVWMASGDFDVNGTYLEASGAANSPATGTLSLTLPVNAVPQRHVFEAAESTEPFHQLNISLHVLQVFRSEATILDPLPTTPGEAISLTVNEVEPIILRLENPGNGEDTFILSARAVASEAMSVTPEVSFTVYNPERTLGALATTIATVDVVLSEEVPALVPFELEFTWTSQGEGNVAALATIDVQAEPDYQWLIEELVTTADPIVPNQEVTVNFNVTNLGNTPDTLTINPRFEVVHAGNDTTQWLSSDVVSGVLQVNETAPMSVVFVVPNDTWYTTEATLVLDLYSGPTLVTNTTVAFTVGHASGWRFNLSDTSLTIAPGGENLTLHVEQLGNHPEAPWFAKAGAGWPVQVPDNGQVVNPKESTTVTVFVTPPEDALAGEVGVLRIRISDGNGAGLIVQEIPVRVGEEANISLDHRGTWKVNEAGGMPTAWIENNGNDVAVMQLNLSGLPTGWVLNGSTQVVVAPGEILGIPYMLTPDENWNEQRFMVTIELQHPTLGLLTLDIEIEAGTHTFHSTPVHSARSDSIINIELGQPVDGQLTSSDEVVFQTQSIEVTVGPVANELILESTLDASERMSVYLRGYELPSVDFECDLDELAFAAIGRVNLDGSVGQCSVMASDEEELRATIMLISNQGETIPLQEDSIVVATGGNSTFELNVTGWMPSPGSQTITVKVVDTYGRVLVEDSVSAVARYSGWNVGIFDFTADGELKIKIQRTGDWNALDGVNCHVSVSSLDGDWKGKLVRVIDVAQGSTPPVVTIPAPNQLAKDDQLVATVRCDSPYDLDDDILDDEATTFYTPDSIPIVESSDLVVGLSVAFLLIIVAYLAGVMQPRSAPKEAPKKKAEPLEEPKPVEEPKAEEDDEIDEFSFELDEPAEELTKEMTQAHTAAIEIIDLPDEADQTPSGRLASLRDEMTTDRPTAEGRSDRMRKFFEND